MANQPRIVASMTTLPSRINTALKAIKTLLQQTRPLDAIYLNIPYITRKGKSYDIPKEMEVLTRSDPRFKINRCQVDYGPITKLVPTLELETDPSTRIITFDDDILVAPTVVEILITQSLFHPGAALSFSGWCVGNMPFPYQIVINADNMTPCDWLQGVHAILYPRSVLDPKELLSFRSKWPREISQILLLNDDHWISGYLESAKVPKLVIPFPANRYFTDLATQAHVIDSISRRREFYSEVYRIGQAFKDAGLYHASYRITRSVIFPFACLFGISVGTLFITRPYIPALAEFILFNILLALLAYRLIRMITVERLILPRLLIHSDD